MENKELEAFAIIVRQAFTQVNSIVQELHEQNKAFVDLTAMQQEQIVNLKKRVIALEHGLIERHLGETSHF